MPSPVPRSKIALALRRMWVVSVAVFVADATVWPMDDNLNFFALCLLARALDGFALGVYHPANPRCSLCPGGPAIRSNVSLPFRTPP